MHRPFEVLLLLSLVLNGASGQGYEPGRYTSPVLSVSKSATKLREQLEQSKKWRVAWKLNPKTACSRAAGSSLCAASSSAGAEEYGQLLLATSPDVYSSLEAKYVGNVRVVGPPGDQGGCSACVAFAVASAAETAVATALRVDVRNCSISVQGLYFCGDPEANSVRSCTDGWSLDLALNYLQQMGHMIPTKEGLPYLPDTLREYTFEQMCGTKQEKPSPNIGLGRFSFRRLTNLLSAQEHIRQYGSIISRFDVYDDFIEFFNRSNNAKKVYKPGPNVTFQYLHAVVVVGYDNNEQYWLAKNSWGTTWGDGGFFRVAYGSCSLIAPETDSPYGVIWSPFFQPKMRQMQVRPAQQPGCFWYQARTGDCASMIAWRAGITLARFLYNNTQTIKSLDTPLDGQQVLLCDPKRDNIAYGDVDPQLQALMYLRAYIDQTGRMRSWSWETSGKGGYCNWQGIKCKAINGTRYISTVRIERNSRFVWLVGQLPPASVLLGMPGLKRLVIREQPGISGPIPEDWSNLTALKYLEEINLDLNSLAGSLPDSWSLLKQLKVLSIQSQNVAGNRKIEGTLPHSWVNLTNMVQFRVANNFLTGTLPASYASMTQLRELKLWGNGFSGELPPEWGTAFTKMEDLQMGRCEVGGTIPAAWGGMTKVKKLYLNQNKFEGPLPESFGNLTAIVEMGLYGNDLTGTIPGSWSNGFKQIQKLDLSDNPDLKGCLPGELQHRLARWGWDMDVGIFHGTRITGC